MVSEEFISLVKSLELQDLPLLGSNFIFFKSGNGCSRSRLDRFLISDVDFGWLDRVVQQAIVKFTSDHLPILLSLEVFSLGS